MTKTEFVEKYAEKTGMSKKDAANAVNAGNLQMAGITWIRQSFLFLNWAQLHGN